MDFTEETGPNYECVLSLMYLVSGEIWSLITYFSFSNWLCVGLAILGMIWWSYKYPDMPRPVKASMASSEKKTKLSVGLLEENEIESPHTSSEELPRKRAADAELSRRKSLYDSMSRYLMSDRQLRRNGYPRPSGTTGRCSFEARAPFDHKRTKKECWRCKRNFVLDGNGKFERENDSCSSRDGFCKTHVHRDNLYDCTGYLESLGEMESGEEPGIYALDCEMCYTVVGLELIRVSVVDFDCKLVYDSLVKPAGRILDYNTKWSGVGEHDMANVTTTLQDVQNEFSKRFSFKTIFVGQSLESDLKALRIIHNTVIDTSVLFPHRRGFPYKRALRHIVEEKIGLIIQNSSAAGHDSTEDAKACVQLMNWKLKQDTKRPA